MRRVPEASGVEVRPVEGRRELGVESRLPTEGQERHALFGATILIISNIIVDVITAKASSLPNSEKIRPTKRPSHRPDTLSPWARVSSTISTISSTVSAIDIVTMNGSEKAPVAVSGFQPACTITACRRRSCASSRRAAATGPTPLHPGRPNVRPEWVPACAKTP